MSQQAIIDELNCKLNEAREVVPAVFATGGELFEHDVADHFGEFDYCYFVYEGRTAKNWLLFHCIEGWMDRGHGGFRDAIGAWEDGKYNVHFPNGDYDKNRINLPPSMCYMFQLYEGSDVQSYEDMPFTRIKVGGKWIWRRQEKPFQHNHVAIEKASIMDSNMSQQAMIDEMNCKLNEAKEAAPALFANGTELLSHVSYYPWMSNEHGPDYFEYEGRTPENWLILHHVIGGNFGKINGGTRDAIGCGWLQQYEMYSPNGEVDITRIKLPPKMCSKFRLYDGDGYDEPYARIEVGGKFIWVTKLRK